MQCMKSAKIITFLLILAAPMIDQAPGAPTTKDATAPRIDPQADKLIKSVLKKYASLTSYQHREKLILTFTRNGQEQKREASTRLIFQKPNKMLLERSGLIVACDGSKFITYYPQLAQYTVRPAGTTITDRQLEQAIMEDNLDPVMTALFSQNPAQNLLKRFNRVDYLGQTTREGKKYYKLRFTAQHKGIMLIDAEKMIFAQITLQPTAPELKKYNQRLVVSYEDLTINEPVADSNFKIKIPQFAKKVPRISFTRQDNHPFLNAPLPPMKLARLNSNSTITPDKLYGKITFVTFWATWCIYCPAELAELQKLYNQYQSKGVTVIAVSTDDKNSLAQVKKFVKQMKLTYPILLDPSKKLFQALGAEALPTMFIVGPSGKIIEAHQGASPRLRFEALGIIDEVLTDKSKRSQTTAPPAG